MARHGRLARILDDLFEVKNGGLETLRVDFGEQPFQLPKAHRHRRLRAQIGERLARLGHVECLVALRFPAEDRLHGAIPIQREREVV